jgi:hypothetical protein
MKGFPKKKQWYTTGRSPPCHILNFAGYAHLYVVSHFHVRLLEGILTAGRLKWLGLVADDHFSGVTPLIDQPGNQGSWIQG